MRLRTRLYLGLLPLLLLVVGTGAYAIATCRQLARVFQQELLASYDAVLASERMRADAAGMDAALAEAQRVDRLLAAAQAFREAREAFNRELMAQSGSAAGTERLPYVARLDAAFQGLAARGDRILPAGLPGTMEALRESEDALHAVLGAIDELEGRDYRAARETQARAARLAATTEDVLLAAIAAAVLVSATLSWRLAVSLLEPIRGLAGAAAALGDGDLDRPVPGSAIEEFNRLAGAFTGMAAKLRAYRDAMAARVLRTQRTMEATLNSTPDPLFVVGRDGLQEVSNPAAGELAAAFSGGFPEGLDERVREVLATGRHFLPADYDHLVTVRVRGEVRHYLPRILAIGDSLTGFGGAAVLLQDVTKLRLLDNAKTNLVGTVSHELKTPLTSLRLAVYLLLENNLGPLAPRQRELLETARDDADRLLRILDDLLDLTRLEGGVARLNRADAPVARLLEDMAREMRPIMDERGQRLDIRIPPEAGTVAVDPDLIRHVFINLLSNASRYSPPGTAITLYAEPADAGFVRCGVLDQGPGVPAEDAGRIFEKFYRVPGEPRKGAGLGLAIAREIVVAHGGSIACAGRPGGGSDFYFVIQKGSG